MQDNNMGALVARRVAYSVAIMAGIIGLFMGLAYWQRGNANLDWRMWTFLGFWGVALAVDTYQFAVRNALAQTRISYGDPESGQDRLDAVLQAMGYVLDHKQGGKSVYHATVYAGFMSRPVTMDAKVRHAVLEGPEFAINKVEQRIESLNYVDMKAGEAASVPLGGPAADYNVPAGYATTEAEVLNPRTA